MDKTNTWLIRVFAVVLVFVCLIAYLNVQANQSLLRPSIEDFDYKAFLLRPKPSIEDLEYKALDKKRANAEFAANRDYTDYEKFGSILFCNASFNSRIESANYSKQMELYISGKEADLSKWDTAIKDYVNERSKCRDFNP
ncbi:5'-3' exonuclease [bacterium]|nr:5'-3' exonuclease [bacterium]